MVLSLKRVIGKKVEDLNSSENSVMPLTAEKNLCSSRGGRSGDSFRLRGSRHVPALPPKQ